VTNFWDRTNASGRRWRARYDAIRRTLERRIGLNRWFPHIPLAIAIGLFGLLLMARVAESLLGTPVWSVWSIRLNELHDHVMGANLGGLPDFVIGGLLLVIAFGLMQRSRFAWWLAILGLSASVAVHVRSDLDQGQDLILAMRLFLVAVLLLNRAHFSARSMVIQTAFGLYSVIVFLACATALTLRRGTHFVPEIADPLTALYFVVVTISSVGFGDIVPQDPDTRGFVLTLIVLGVLILGTAISVFLIPLISNRLRVILGHQEKLVNRSKHFVVIGISPLARNAAEELEKRNQAVTLILPKANTDGFYAKRDVVIGDPTDLEILREAGVAKARGVLALSVDDSTNGFVVLGVNELDPSITTVAALNEPTNQSRLERAQPSILLSLQVLGGQLLAMALTGERVEEDMLANVLKIHSSEPAKRES
jgi:voltage-gated potassium channel